jgi:hypothetical protein
MRFQHARHRVETFIHRAVAFPHQTLVFIDSIPPERSQKRGAPDACGFQGLGSANETDPAVS